MDRVTAEVFLSNPKGIVVKMLKKSLARILGLSVMVSGSLLMVGCASLGASKPEDIVKQRSETFWAARVAGQMDKAYALTTPSYRKLRTLEQYQSQYAKGAGMKQVSVIKVTCEPEKCTVRTKIEAAPPLMGVSVGTIATHSDEIWLLEDGQWWRYQDL